MLPPTIKVTQPVEALAARRTPFYVNTLKRPWLPRPSIRARPSVRSASAVAIFTVSWKNTAPTSPRLTGTIRCRSPRLPPTTAPPCSPPQKPWLTERPWEELCRAAAQTRVAFSVNRGHRLVFVLERDKTALARLQSVLPTLAQREANKKSWSSPDGIIYGSGHAAGTLALLFPGQGSQYPGMLRDVACRFPQAQQVLAEADAAFGTRNAG